MARSKRRASFVSEGSGLKCRPLRLLVLLALTILLLLQFPLLLCHLDGSDSLFPAGDRSSGNIRISTLSLSLLFYLRTINWR
ncbi:hypothetical protein ATY79_21825 [Rhizobium sp. R693]|nr:hypothetical protein ATY79_21825 [Rhizobium sp. R693]